MNKKNEWTSKLPELAGRWLVKSPLGEVWKVTIEQCMDFYKGPSLCVVSFREFRMNVTNFHGWQWQGPLDEPAEIIEPVIYNEEDEVKNI